MRKGNIAIYYNGLSSGEAIVFTFPWGSFSHGFVNLSALPVSQFSS